MEVALLTKGRTDQRKEQEMQKWDDVYRNVCCNRVGALPFISNFFCVFLYKII